MSSSKVLLQILEEFDFSDLEQYPNVGINRKGEIEEFSYSGNFFIRNRNARLLFTQEAQNEYDRCEDDFFYFLKYVKIETLDAGIIAFEPRKWQIETIKDIQEFKKMVLNVARQSGKSTIIVAYILWLVIFESNLKYGIVANKSDLTIELVGMLKNMYMLLPPFLQHNVVKWNQKSIELSNGNKVVSAVAGSSALRGQTISFLLCQAGEEPIEIYDTVTNKTIITTFEEFYQMI